MYKRAEALMSESIGLIDRLKSDSSGELRDLLIQQLQDAEDQIHASLAMSIAEGDAQLLRRLLEAVNVGEQSLIGSWNSLHGNPASVPARKRL